MNFQGFANLCERNGLTARLCNQYHWQITGGRFIVNYYPTKGTVYLCGVTEKERRNAKPEYAVALALGQKELTRKERRHERVRYAGIKNVRLAANPFCHWCDKPLDKSTATADHLIPLSRGGPNEDWNIVIACLKCNKMRGDSTGAPTP